MAKGERIKSRREQLGITQISLADKVGISKQNLYKYENNIITNIPSDVIEKIADVLNCTPGYLMGWDDTIDYEYKWYESGGGQHPLKLSPEEYSLILSFRKSDDTTKDMVNRILKYKELLEKRLNNANS